MAAAAAVSDTMGTMSETMEKDNDDDDDDEQLERSRSAIENVNIPEKAKRFLIDHLKLMTYPQQQIQVVLSNLLQLQM